MTVPIKGGRPKSPPISHAEKLERAAWSRVMNQLPDTASNAADINWIRNHPAMTQLDRLPHGSKVKRIIITSKDVKRLGMPLPPSKAAVHMLQHWCNRPNDFFKMILSEQKKTAAGGKSEILDDVGDKAQEIKDIDSLLAALDCAVKQR